MTINEKKGQIKGLEDDFQSNKKGLKMSISVLQYEEEKESIIVLVME